MDSAGFRIDLMDGRSLPRYGHGQHPAARVEGLAQGNWVRRDHTKRERFLATWSDTVRRPRKPSLARWPCPSSSPHRAGPSPAGGKRAERGEKNSRQPLMVGNDFAPALSNIPEQDLVGIAALKAIMTSYSAPDPRGAGPRRAVRRGRATRDATGAGAARDVATEFPECTSQANKLRRLQGICRADRGHQPSTVRA